MAESEGEVHKEEIRQVSAASPSLSTEIGPKDYTDPNCIFCKICCKESPAEIVYEDSDYVCFVDRKPCSTHHYLVVPRQHIQGPGVLCSSHTPMVEHMADIGKQVLQERGGTPEEARIGFHWPPFLLVKHLHLHVISPENSMGWINRNIVFRKDSFVFSSPTYMVDYLKKKTQ